MKTDNYLTLCLEQAAKSPLHYRHGAIIVRGGKVIGQGYNDYRPGYDGGALKHGRIAKANLDGPAIASLREKLKKQKGKPKGKQYPPQPSQNFVPFEGTGGGHNANSPLSMHSEMMAIHSALSSSTRLSWTTASFKSAVLKLPYLDQTLHHHARNNNKRKEEREDNEEVREHAEVRRLKEKGLAFHEQLGGEKHHQKRKEKKKDGQEKDGQKKAEYQYETYGRCGRQKQQQAVRRESASSGLSGDGTIRGYEQTTDINERIAAPSSVAKQHGKLEKDYKRSGKMKTQHAEPPQPEPLLLPKGHGGLSSHSIKDRKKHPRLNGADLYVTRLGWCKVPSKSQPQAAASDTATHVLPDTAASDEELTSTSSSSSLSSGSLHDELINRDPSPSPSMASKASNAVDTSLVRASRPCYRCISYMHSVGIKRVFWTNDAGEWEGGKVRDFVDALDCSVEAVASGEGDRGGPMGNGVFVTKHEVLMLKRMMGGV